MQVILALDVGSSSARCSAYRILKDDPTTVQALNDCSAQRKIRSVQPNTGKIKLTGEDCSLLDEIDACVDTTLQALRDNGESFQVVGLGFSTFVMNLVGVDKNGHVVGEEATISYACNTREVANECRTLRRELGEERLKDLYQKTGAPLHSAYAVPQLRVLYSNPENQHLCERIHKWQTLASMCLARWRGTLFSPISYSEASWTGLLNFSSCEWDEDALALLPRECQETLPPLSDYSNSLDGIDESMSVGTEMNPYWDRWPELRKDASCHFFLGLGDGACANIGSKCSTPSRIAVTVGTSAAARVCLPLPCGSDLHVPPGLFCYRVDKSHVLVGGALTDGGSVVEWACSLLNLNSNDAFQECMKEVEDLVDQDASMSLTVVPFLSGERSTGFRDGAKGCIMGLTRETTPALFMKACLEGVMLRLKAILQLVREAIDERSLGNEQEPYVVVSGNAMEKNALWRQMLADASGLETQLDNDFAEGTSRGAARLVAIALDRKSDEDSDSLMTEEKIDSPTVSYPRTSATKGYWAKATESQEDLIDAVTPLWL